MSAAQDKTNFKAFRAAGGKSHDQSHDHSSIALCRVVFQRLDDLDTPIDTLDLKGKVRAIPSSVIQE